MKVPTIYCMSLALLLILEVHTKKLDSNTESTSSAVESTSSTSKTSEVPSQAKKKRYATREVILYLTPSQVKALEAGEGLVSLQSLSEPVEQPQPTIQDLKLQEQMEFVKQEFENIKSASIQEVEQPVEENLELASQEPILPNTLLSTEHQQELIDQEEQVKLHNYYHELNKAEQIKLQQEVNGERNAWLAYNPNIQINEGYQVHELQQDDHIVDGNKFLLKALPPLQSYGQNSESIVSQTSKPLLQLQNSSKYNDQQRVIEMEQILKTLLELQYSPKYNDQQRAIQIEQILRTVHQHELEKQSDLSQVEKIHNAPAILVHDNVQITKQHAVPEVKNVRVPGPAPVWVSVPEPIPIRVPYQYPVLQQIIKHIPVPIEEKGSVERPVQLNVGTSSPFSKIVFLNVGTPHVDQKIVPVEVKSWS